MQSFAGSSPVSHPNIFDRLTEDIERCIFEVCLRHLFHIREPGCGSTESAIVQSVKHCTLIK